MKLQIVGIEASEGVSSKSGKAYSMGSLHTLAALAPARNKDNVAKGQMGTAYRCDMQLIKSIAHLPFPLMAEVTLEPQMMFGKREDVVTDVKPVSVVTAKAA